MWHYRRVLARFQIVLQLLTDLAGIIPLAVRRQGALAAEILMLRRQLALYVERGVKPRRIDPATRITLALRSRFLDWRNAGGGAPRDDDPLAPGRLAAVLAPEVSTPPTADP